MAESDPQYWPDFEEIGEAQVRADLTMGLYGGTRKCQAEAWLEHVRHSREALADERDADFARQQIAIARDAADSAREAAVEARNANRIAKIALAVAATAVIVSVIGLLLKDVP